MKSPQVVMDLDEALSYCDQDHNFLKIILEQYWRLWPDTRADLEGAVVHQDWTTLEKVAHRVKGQAASIAARQVKAAAQQLERHGIEAAPETLQHHLNLLIRAQRTLRQFHIEHDLIVDDQLPPV